MGTKVYINGQDGHHAHISICGKNLQNFPLLNQKSYVLETWHAASGTQVYKIYKNHDAGLTLTYFMARSNLATYVFEREKTVTKSFKGKKNAANDQINLQKIYVFAKSLIPGRGVSLYI